MQGMKTQLPGSGIFAGILILSVQLVTCYQLKWDHFMFAQAWPPGTCTDATREGHTCHIGPFVKTWTIHGLWPSEGEEKGPTNCNNSWHFDFNQIKDLRTRLNAYWPNLYNDTDPYSFWEHEWEKHGTCCTDLDTTAGELNYFTAGLELNRQYDIFQILSKVNVVPSETTQYSYDDFVDGVKKAIGYEPVIQCAYKKLKNGTGYHLIDQVQICLNKDFSPRSCIDGTVYPSGHYFKGNNSLSTFEKGEKNDLVGKRHSHHHYYEPQSSCPKKENFYYPPIHTVLYALN